MTATLVVDAHHHFWRLDEQEQRWRTPEHEAIAADFLPADLEGELRRSGVDATVLVEAVDTAAENDGLRDHARSVSFVAALVGWLPLGEPAEARRELNRCRSAYLRGVRCQVGREPLDRLEQPETISLFRALADEGLAWDVVAVTADQKRSVARIARAVPTLRIVIDHLARPPLETAGWQPWAEDIRRLADCPNVALKLSVGVDALTSWRAWEATELAPYVAFAVECFGPSRLMLASNWPIVLLRQTYERAWGDLVESVELAGVGGAQLDEVLGGTAVRWYDLATLAQGRP